MQKSHTQASAVRHQTTAPVQPGLEWLRPADVPKVFSLSRATAYRLMDAGKIKSTVLRVMGNKSGMRLISAQSIRDLLTAGAA